jgi:hypothetical protein
MSGTLPRPRWSSFVTWRLALVAVVIAYAVAMRQVVGPCDAFGSGLLLVLPIFAVQSLAALACLVLATIALVRRRCRSALVELGMALLMLATFPAAMAANAVMTDDCATEDPR